MGRKLQLIQKANDIFNYALTDPSSSASSRLTGTAKIMIAPAPAFSAETAFLRPNYSISVIGDRSARDLPNLRRALYPDRSLNYEWRFSGRWRRRSCAPIPRWSQPAGITLGVLWGRNGHCRFFRPRPRSHNQCLRISSAQTRTNGMSVPCPG